MYSLSLLCHGLLSGCTPWKGSPPQKWQTCIWRTVQQREMVEQPCVFMQKGTPSGGILTIQRLPPFTGGFERVRFTPHMNDAGRPRHARTANNEEHVLEVVAQNPRTSTRAVAADLGISHASVWRTLHFISNGYNL